MMKKIGGLVFCGGIEADTIDDKPFIDQIGGSKSGQESRIVPDKNEDRPPPNEASVTSTASQEANKGASKDVPKIDRSFKSFNTESSIEISAFLQEKLEAEELQLTDEMKNILRESWQVIYEEVGHALCFVGDTPVVQRKRKEDGSIEEIKHRGVAETFFRLFEEYPQSRAFFGHLGSTSMQSLSSDLKLTRALQEHAIRVIQVVEKIIARLDEPQKVNKYLVNLGRYHNHAKVPTGYFSVMGAIFINAVKPYLDMHNVWSSEVETSWLILFDYIARIMTIGHNFS